MKKFYIIDASTILHRSWHAIPHLKNNRGETINAVYGFTSVLLKILNQEKPPFLAIAFDTKSPTFRHRAYKEYKANRVTQPPEFYQQIPWVKKILDSLELKSFTCPGLEADDLIGALDEAKKQSSQKLKSHIITGDLDLLQLVKSETEVCFLQQGLKANKIYNPFEVQKKFGVTPQHITDLKSLVGDTADNIKGVKNVGPKTAAFLIQKFENVENIYQYLTKNKQKKDKKFIKESLRKNLLESKDQVFLNKKLVTIQKKAPNVNPQIILECKVKKLNLERAFPVLKEIGLKKFSEKVKEMNQGLKQNKLF
jgi:DNA polymerase-1